MLQLRLLLLCAMFIIPTINQAAVMVDETPQSTDSQIQLMQDMTIQDFVNLSPQDVQARTGEKMKLGERVALRLAQRKAKKAMKKGESMDFAAAYEDAKGGFSIGGFLLGFFLGLIGVLIALLFGRDAVRSALLGMLCWIIIIVIIWVL